ncbi:MAG: AraC family transcriptional regulator [Pseudomonadota bacterium]
MSTVDLIEIILRGGAASICIVMIGHLLAPRPITSAAVYGAMFALGAATYSVVALPAVLSVIGSAYIPFKVIGISSPAWFWLFVRALHDDGYKFSPVDLLAPGTLSAIYLACEVNPELQATSMYVQLGLVLAMMAHTIHIVRCCEADDLVPSRRHLSRTLEWLIPIVAAAILGVEALEIADMEMDGGAPAWARLVTACTLIFVAVGLTLSLARLRESLLPLPDENRASGRLRAHASRAGHSAADRIDLGRLRDLMEAGAYLSSGMTIGELANQMGLPEHRLRRLINGALGYRNFAAFLNDYRVTEAKHRLSQPEMVHTQITNLAFDLGYASLAPFNRAFRERTGMSPSDWRESNLLQYNDTDATETSASKSRP